MRSQLKVRRELALSVLETHLKDVATWNIPKGGFFVWVKILPSISMKLLYTKALSKGILLNLGRIYAEEKGNYIRLSYAYASLEDLQKGIYELGLMIKELASR